MTQVIFNTYKPLNETVAKFVEYYYVHLSPSNSSTEFVGFPHTNTTLSLYPSHIRKLKQETYYSEDASFLQSYTSIRNKILTSRLYGNINKITIVFRTLGIQQFFDGIDFTRNQSDHDFFTPEELTLLFAKDSKETVLLLDQFLFSRYRPFDQKAISFSIDYIKEHITDFSVEELAEKSGISRRHLNRLFNQHLGVNIKKFHEILVFRSILNSKQFEKSPLNFTQLAYEFNLSDQSHLNKIFENMTLQPPSSFFKNGIHLGDEDTFWHLESK
ncbi:AraC family transcriptional regulator [Elizabethkingia meningoseptica]|uniref:helix-turn-helix domain-containing protein n=1 Tax=Elizabethkingia meningoseptica TaxID=238 RepID=UPI0023B043D6|nr:AraC family transcriptional regulator [Elizabethkingia meningoseptica]MDE5470112.1 AraC family transcriptional regulator [Elizabethkingia meningoseptica]